MRGLPRQLKIILMMNGQFRVFRFVVILLILLLLRAMVKKFRVRLLVLTFHFARHHLILNRLKPTAQKLRVKPVKLKLFVIR